MSAADGKVFGSFKLVDHGKSSHRFNLVFLSEGYQTNEIPLFMAVVNEALKIIRLSSPFQALWPDLNVHQINVGSVESGADIPTLGVKARTFFDATYGTGCHERRLLVDVDAVLEVSSRFVNGMVAPIVIVNSMKHGGSSGWVITTASGAKGGVAQVVMHELGHFLAGLADEYNGSSDCPGHAPQAQFAGLEPDRPNITTVRDRFILKWDDLVGLATNVPTLVVPTGECVNPPPQSSPVDDGAVGTFEGAGTFNCGLFRSEFNCLMRAKGFPFCKVCTRTLQAKIRNWTLRPAELSRDIWTPGWDEICAIEIDGAAHLVSYKPASGSIAIDKVRADGSGTDPVLGSTWSTGWTSIVPLQLAGTPHLLLYKSATGQMEIDEVVNSGQDVNAVSSDTWTQGWTSIVPFTMAGTQFIFSYKQGIGSMAIDRVRDDASGTDPILGATWTSDWSHHAIWEQPFGATIVSYKTDDGTLDVDRILASGAVTETIISTAVDAGFTSLVPLSWHGEPVFVLHDLSNGVSTIQHIHDPGPGAKPPPDTAMNAVVGEIGDILWSAGWESLTPFELAGQPHWLAYNGNVAVIDRID